MSKIQLFKHFLKIEIYWDQLFIQSHDSIFYCWWLICAFQNVIKNVLNWYKNSLNVVSGCNIIDEIIFIYLLQFIFFFYIAEQFVFLYFI